MWPWVTSNFSMVTLCCAAAALSEAGAGWSMPPTWAKRIADASAVARRSGFTPAAARGRDGAMIDPDLPFVLLDDASGGAARGARLYSDPVEIVATADPEEFP